MKTAVFIGHNECYGLKQDKLDKAILKCIENGVTTFLSGGQGGFDRKCALTVYNFKKRYPNINNILVMPYLTFNIFNKEIFDEIILPDNFEKYHYKFAIIKRNQYMVNKSNIAICYINHGWGNAVKTYEYAQKKKIEILNLSSYNQ